MKSIRLLFPALLAWVPASSSGQAAEDATRPTPPPESRPESRVAASRDDRDTRGAVVAGHDEELLPSLAGLAIAPTTGQVLAMQAAAGRSPAADGISIDGFTAAEQAAIRKAAARFVGQPVSLRSLEELSTALEEEVRVSGQRLVRTSYPPQEITSGVVAIRVSPARAGQVGIAGKRAFNLPFAAGAFRTRPGDPISPATVIEDLEWMNLNPLRRASISYADGSADDQLDLTLRLRDTKPWRVYGGIDNQLSDSLGDERLFLGYQHGNVFGLDHRFTGQYTAALEFERLQGLSAAYEVPLPVRHLLQFSGGYTESETEVLGPIDQSGTFSRFAMGYRVPLPRWRNISHEWRAGAEFRYNDYLFPNNTDQTVRFFQLETGWKGRRKDRYGITRLDASVLYNPGQGIFGSEDADFIALGADGAESLIARANLERAWDILDLAVLHTRIRAQWADSELLASDQLSAGGMNRVRGFDETVGYASTGLIAGVELHSMPWKTQRAGDLTGLVFVDGAVLNRDAPSDPGELLSAGAGLRWRFNELLAARIDFAFPIEHPDRIDDDMMSHFGLQFTW
jgi:hemolysin activation/secretion protein